MTGARFSRRSCALAVRVVVAIVDATAERVDKGAAADAAIMVELAPRKCRRFMDLIQTHVIKGIWICRSFTDGSVSVGAVTIGTDSRISGKCGLGKLYIH